MTTEQSNLMTAAERRKMNNKRYYEKSKASKKSEVIEMSNSEIELLKEENRNLKDEIKFLEANIETLKTQHKYEIEIAVLKNTVLQQSIAQTHAPAPVPAPQQPIIHYIAPPAPEPAQQKYKPSQSVIRPRFSITDYLEKHNAAAFSIETFNNNFFVSRKDFEEGMYMGDRIFGMVKNNIKGLMESCEGGKEVLPIVCTDLKRKVYYVKTDELKTHEEYATEKWVKTDDLDRVKSILHTIKRKLQQFVCDISKENSDFEAEYRERYAQELEREEENESGGYYTQKLEAKNEGFLQLVSSIMNFSTDEKANEKLNLRILELFVIDKSQ